MKKKMIALSLSSILLFGCGATKPASDGCCEKVVMTQEDHHEKACCRHAPTKFLFQLALPWLQDKTTPGVWELQGVCCQGQVSSYGTLRGHSG